MIRLELTLAEAQQLHQCVTDTLRQSTHKAVTLCLQTLLTKLAAAADNAMRRRQCPVCQQWFTQEHTGRSGRYCGAACKQKAYRQRRLDDRKQFGPPQCQ